MKIFNNKNIIEFFYWLLSIPVVSIFTGIFHFFWFVLYCSAVVLQLQIKYRVLAGDASTWTRSFFFIGSFVVMITLISTVTRYSL